MDFKVKGLRGLFGQEQPYGSSRASVGRAIGAGVFQNALNPNSNNPRIRVSISTDISPDKVKSTLEKSDSSKVSDSSTATKAASKVTTQSLEVSKKLDALSALKQIVDSANALTSELKSGIGGERASKIQEELSTLQGAYKDVLVDSAGEDAVDTTSLVSNPAYGSLVSQSSSLAVDIEALQASLGVKEAASAGQSGLLEDAKYSRDSLIATSAWLNPESGMPDPIADASANMDAYGGREGLSVSNLALSTEIEALTASWNSYVVYDSDAWNANWSTTWQDTMSLQTSDLLYSSEYYDAIGDTLNASLYADSAAALYTAHMDASYQANVAPQESIAAKVSASSSFAAIIESYDSLTLLQASIPQLLSDQLGVVSNISASLGAIETDISAFQVSLTSKQAEISSVRTSLSSTNQNILVGQVASVFDNVSMIDIQVTNSAAAENAITSLQSVSEAVDAQIRVNEYELSSLQNVAASSSSSYDLTMSVTGGNSNTEDVQGEEAFRETQELTRSIAQQLLSDPALGRGAIGNLRSDVVQSLLNTDVLNGGRSQSQIVHKVSLDQKV